MCVCVCVCVCVLQLQVLIHHALLQAAAEGSLASLEEQLAGMTEVHSQLEEAVKALQGKLELRDQELEVVNMELLAKDKVAALHQAIRDQMALQMPLPQVRLPSVTWSVCCLVMPVVALLHYCLHYCACELALDHDKHALRQCQYGEVSCMLLCFAEWRWDRHGISHKTPDFIMLSEMTWSCLL